MKSYSNIYENLLDEGDIVISIYDALKHRKKTPTVLKMTDPLNVGYYATDIKNKILSGKLPAQFPRRKKEIYESNAGKKRMINVPNHYEHILHHILCKKLEPLFTKGMYRYTVASIPGKGDMLGKRYLDSWIRKHKDSPLYVLKLDIHHFFDSVDRNILFQKFKARIRDTKLLEMLEKIIWYDRDYEGVGIPIGFYTSQWFANFFLQELDHLIKETLGVACYVRYMDDLVLIDFNKAKLHAAHLKIRSYLRSINLEINDNWQVFRFSYSSFGKEKGRAIDFMGYVFHHNRTVLRKNTLSKVRRKANALYKKHDQNKKITWYDAVQFMSRLGRMVHTQTYHYFLRYIYTKVDIEFLRHIISEHSKYLHRRKEYEQFKLLQSGKQRLPRCPRYHFVSNVRVC